MQKKIRRFFQCINSVSNLVKLGCKTTKLGLQATNDDHELCN
jgi:hypothetical protein